MAAEKPSSEARRQRLAKALKANIAKRKAQARAQERAGAQPPPGEPDAVNPAAEEDGCPN